MAEKFNLERMLREAAEDEGASGPAARKGAGAQQELRNRVASRHKTTRPDHAIQS